jgi:DNA-binding GntR family transcriptional regulator
MPVVDALSRLEGEGLVERRKRVGTFVAPLDQALFDEMFETRLMIEMWAAPLIVAGMQAGDREALVSLLSEAGLLLNGATDNSFDYLTFVRYDAEFHLGLIRLAGNSRVIDIYESLNLHAQVARVYSLRALQRAQEGQREHEAILAAFAVGDVEQARAAQQLHIERSRQGLRALLDRHGEL